MKQQRYHDHVRERPSLYRAIGIALVAITLAGTGLIVMLIISFAMAMRSFGNK